MQKGKEPRQHAVKVLGAFWYCFSIQRTVACWYMVCENHGGCVRNSFYCDHNFDNHSFLDDICRKNLPNTELFDFGVYFDAYQSRISESKSIPQKIFYCFCWGMRNLSSFGSNLQTSNDMWENCFALCITIFGLLLFVYFMGNLQMHMQRQTSNLIKDHEDMKKPRREKKADKSSKRRKIQEQNIRLWMSRHKLSTEIRREINDFIKQRFDEDEDVYVENLIPELPTELGNNVKRHICLDVLKKVEVLRCEKEQFLLNLCESLKPMFYKEHDYIIREGDPIDTIFLITDGVAISYTNPTIYNDEGTVPKPPERLVKGQCFGVELLEWVQKSNIICRKNLFELPVSSKTLEAHKKVEAFALMADDLRQKWHSAFSRSDPEELEYKAASFVQHMWRRNHPKTDDSIRDN